MTINDLVNIRLLFTISSTEVVKPVKQWWKTTLTDNSYNHAIKLDTYLRASINKWFDVSPDTIVEGRVWRRFTMTINMLEKNWGTHPNLKTIWCCSGQMIAMCLKALNPYFNVVGLASEKNVEFVKQFSYFDYQRCFRCLTKKHDLEECWYTGLRKIYSS